MKDEKHKIKKILIVFATIFVVLLIFVLSIFYKKAFGAYRSPIYLYDPDTGIQVPVIPVSPSECTGAPPVGYTCYNASSNTYSYLCPGPPCGFGEPWSVYKAVCAKEVVVEIPDWEEERVKWYYQYAYSYSIADKCIAGEIGLRHAYCGPGQYNGLYKLCCRSPYANQNLPLTAACVQVDLDPFPPPEGVCPSGYTPVPCGPHPQAKGPCDPNVICTTPPPPPPPPPPSPSGSTSGEGELRCNVSLSTSVNPQEGKLNTDFEIKYGLSVSGEPKHFSWNCVRYYEDNCVKEVINGTPIYGKCTFKDSKPHSADLTPSCGVTSGKVYLKFLGIKKDWDTINEITIPQSQTPYPETLDSFDASSGNLQKTFTFIPEYHGWQKLRVETTDINLNAQVTFYCDEEGYAPEPSSKSETLSVGSLSSNLEFLVNPTDVIAQAPTLSSNPPKPTKYITTLQKYIVGFTININNFGVTLGDPGVFKKDSGSYWLTINGVQHSSNYPLQDITGGSRASTSFLPLQAGGYTFCTVHDADDERYNPPNLERACNSITVYRYLCYSGFCYECSNEPTTRGGFINLRSGNCKVVEAAKCKAYIGSDCKAKGRE